MSSFSLSLLLSLSKTSTSVTEISQKKCNVIKARYFSKFIIEVLSKLNNILKSLYIEFIVKNLQHYRLLFNKSASIFQIVLVH